MLLRNTSNCARIHVCSACCLALRTRPGLKGWRRLPSNLRSRPISQDNPRVKAHSRCNSRKTKVKAHFSWQFLVCRPKTLTTGVIRSNSPRFGRYNQLTSRFTPIIRINILDLGQDLVCSAPLPWCFAQYYWLQMP